MTFGDMTRAALRNLGRRKVRTALTSTGVIVGILTIVTMVSLGVGVQREIEQQFAQLGLENVFVRPRTTEGDNFFTQFSIPERQNPISPEVVAQWRELPDVERVTPLISLDGVVTLLQFPTLGGEAPGGLRSVQVNPPFSFPDPFERPPEALAGTLEIDEAGGEVVLDRNVVPANVTPEEAIGAPVNIVLRSPRGEEEAFPLTISGVSDRGDGDVQVAVADMAAMKSWWFNLPDYLASQGYDFAVVSAQNVGEAANLVRRFREDGFRVQSLELILDTANRAFAVINIMLASVGGLALFVACLGIINTMIMAIYERTREIGTLKAIGASRGDIRWLFMLEAGMIGLIGGAIGVVGGWVLGIGLNRLIQWYIEQQDLPVSADFFVVTWWLALAALGFAALVGIVAGLYPANRAARLDPLVALRYE